ncbi:MAG: transaldolase [Candidatus Dormibacteraeota bacterium]|nr:transaldolase [Candidatus Dormibacteraeota bacterium]
MTERHVAQMHEERQVVWLDNLSRRLVRSGDLARLRDLGVTGITSNPTIFQHAIAGGQDYDEEIGRLAGAGRTPDQILWDLIIQDVSEAADLFRPVFDSTGGRDGFVSIEVSPDVAHSVERTVEMARELRRRCDRANVLVKIPATLEGVSAIRKMIGEGAGINVTLIFSVARYEQVAEAFFAGLEDLRAAGGAVRDVNSVASFFVSRVDAKVDKLIDEARPENAKRLSALRGRIGIANSKMAYQRYKALHAGPRWDGLAAAGARPQRCLWASTSVKDPRYPDTMYVENLIGPETIDTLPEKTLEAFIDHGVVHNALEEDVDQARRDLDQLAAMDVSLERVTDELENEGVQAFAASYKGLLDTLRERVGALDEARGSRMQ